MDHITAPPLPLSDSPGKDSASTPDRELYLLERANQIFGSYRKDEAANADQYVSSVVAILSEYDNAVIERVADPRTGIAKTAKFLPSIAELSEECERHAAEFAKAKANADFQARKAATKTFIPPLVHRPNLFMRSDLKWYPAMVERAAKENPDMSRVELDHLCIDGVRRSGIWIPSNWYYELNTEAKHAVTG